MAKRITLILLIGLAVATLMTIVTAGFGVRALSKKAFTEMGCHWAAHGAATCRQEMERGIQNNVIQMSDLFSPKYTTYTTPDGEIRYRAPYEAYLARYVNLASEEFLGTESLYYAYAVAADGYVPLHSDAAFVNTRIEPPIPHEGKPAGTASTVSRIWRDPAGNTYYEYSAPIFIGNRQWGSFRAGIPTALVSNEVRRHVLYAVLVSGLGSLLVAALIYTVVRRELRPLKTLTKAAEAVGQADFSVRCIYTGPDELGRLAQAFNNMARTVEESHERMVAQNAELLQTNAELVNQSEQRAKAEESVRTSEMMLNMVLASIPLAVFWKNTESTYLGGNDAFARLVGLSSLEDLKGKTDYDMPWRREKADHFVRRDQRIMATGLPEVHIVEPLLIPPNTHLWVEVNLVPLYGDGSRIVGVLGTIEDITEHRRTEAALLETDEKYRQVFATVGDATILLDANTLKIEDANAAALKMYGYTKQELLGMSISDLTAQPDSTRAAFNELTDGSSLTVPLRYHHRQNGDLFPVEGTMNRFRLNNRSLVCIVSRDISQRVQDEEELRRHRSHLERLVDQRTTELTHVNEQLETEIEERIHTEEQLQDANADLSQYAYVVSHDIKAPLRAIANYAEFLREDLGDSLEEEPAVYLANLLRSVSQAETLVSDLLSLSRISRRKLDYHAIEMKGFLNDVIQSLHLDEDIEVVILGDEWPRIELEPTLARQIFQNLIQNAAKFSVGGNKRIELSWAPEGVDRLRFGVRDFGIGIAQEDQESIFRVFHRLHSEAEFEGTGIGLAIVRKSVQRLGGRLDLKSAPGQGSTFSVILPRTQARREPEPAA